MLARFRAPLPRPGGRPAAPARHGLGMRNHRGFALVITLSLMVLLALLAVGALGLASTALRSARASHAQAEARANARLALALALNDLQIEAGPDQRITAPAAILARDRDDVAPDDAAFNPRTTSASFAHPHWLGSWNSWTHWLNESGLAQTYVPGREPHFRRWLVSHSDLDSMADLAAADNGVPHPASTVLVGTGTLGQTADPSDHVTAPLIHIASHSDGAFAWWVTGNNQRALIRPTDTAAADSIGGSANRLASRSSSGVEALEGLSDLPTDPADLDRSFTLATLELTGAAALPRGAVTGNFHHLTATSVGLPVNVRDGGLKHDLNLLLEMPVLPAEYGTYRRAVPDGSIVPIREHSADLDQPFYHQNLNFTSWYKLQQYYRLAHGDHASASDEVAADSHPLPLRRGIWWSDASTPNTNFTWERQNLDYYGWGRTPIISRAMILFSLRRMPSAATPGHYAYQISFNPVVVLWNPYNVTLHTPPVWLQFTPGSLEYRVYQNGTSSGNWQRFGGQLANFRLEARAARDSPAAFSLKPGETRIFSSQTGGGGTIQLTPGFQPPMDGGGFDRDIPGLSDVPPGTDIEFAMRMNDQRTDHGGQYQMYWTIRNIHTGGGQRFNEMAANPVQDGLPIPIVEDQDGKRLSFNTNTTRLPFASFEFVLKSGEDLRNPGAAYENFDARGKNFVHAKPWNQRAMYGEATGRMRAQAQYHIHVAVGSGNALNPDFDHGNSRAYLGSAISLGRSDYPGQPLAVMTELPVVPPSSLAGLAHFRLNPGDTRVFSTGRHLWEISTNDALGISSSFGHPLIPADRIHADVPDAACRGNPLQMKLIRDYYDHGFLNNDALWDRWFCSGISTQSGPASLAGANQTSRATFEQFINHGTPLANPHAVLDRPQLASPAQALAQLFSGDHPSAEAHRKVARYLNIEGAFNVNSTSVPAWKAFLSGLQEEVIHYIDPESGRIQSATVPADRVVLSRFALPNHPTEGEHPGDPAAWGGVRLLTPEQIDRLAAECVRQVKLRGPFLNLADFINRRLSNDETGLAGALQAAIDWDEFNGNGPDPQAADSINGRYKRPADMITAADVSAMDYENPGAATGSIWTGIPGYLTQPDLLRRLGNALTVRDDTFTIRTYGEARNTAGQVIARAWCEAVVVRTKDYLDRADSPETMPADLSDINRTFGRRFRVVSFRWLGPEEI